VHSREQITGRDLESPRRGVGLSVSGRPALFIETHSKVAVTLPIFTPRRSPGGRGWTAGKPRPWRMTRLMLAGVRRPVAPGPALPASLQPRPPVRAPGSLTGQPAPHQPEPGTAAGHQALITAETGRNADQADAADHCGSRFRSRRAVIDNHPDQQSPPRTPSFTEFKKSDSVKLGVLSGETLDFRN